jgi:hypothetical protein
VSHYWFTFDSPAGITRDCFFLRFFEVRILHIWAKIPETEEDTGDEIELVLGAMEFPTTQKWLQDPNVWVGDTWATVHMTPHRQGMTNLKMASGKDAVTMGNGQSETASQIGDIPGTICDKTGTTVSSTKIQDALFLPSAMYNLFSITKLQWEGWTLYGDAKCLKLSKSKATIKFDILILTAKGMLYVMYHQCGSEVANARTDQRKIRDPRGSWWA